MSNAFFKSLIRSQVDHISLLW